MIKFIGALISLISFILLTSAWIYITSRISFIIILLLKNRCIKIATFSYSILVGILIEILLAFVSVVFFPDSTSSNNSLNREITSYFENGKSFAVLFSPISSIFGVLIGTKINIRKSMIYKIFRKY